MKVEKMSPIKSVKPVLMLLGAPVLMLLLFANAAEDIAKAKREAKSMFRRFFIASSPNQVRC